MRYNQTISLCVLYKLWDSYALNFLNIIITMICTVSLTKNGGASIVFSQ
jgi:hypothetical protein